VCFFVAVGGGGCGRRRRLSIITSSFPQSLLKNLSQEERT
jgi:hypothetical protein